jgi:signal transduction histidine kinase
MIKKAFCHADWPILGAVEFRVNSPTGHDTRIAWKSEAGGWRRDALQEVPVSRAQKAKLLRHARREILTRLGHELRTPLNSVIGFSGVLKRNRAGNQSTADLEMLERIRVSGERLLDLVEDLFDIGNGGPSEPILLAPVDVGAVVREAARSRADAAAAKGLTIDVVIEAHGSVELDAARLSRMLRKLLCNAVKFTDRGGVTITVRGCDGRDRPASIEVRDTGCGIPAELHTSIFEPFTQAETSECRAHDGAGLGLPIARRLAESMGCRLTVESEVEVGATFTVKLPG